MGWKANLWAHFLGGDHALLILRNLLHPIGAVEAGQAVSQPLIPSAVPDRQ